MKNTIESDSQVSALESGAFVPSGDDLAASIVSADSVLASVVAEHGMFSESQLPALAAAFPEMLACAKMGCSSRFCVPLRAFAETIQTRLALNPDDYIREAYLPCSVVDPLRVAFGLPAD